MKTMRSKSELYLIIVHWNDIIIYVSIYFIYRKSGNFHVEIIHVVNIQC